MEDRRLLLAVALSVVVLLAWQLIFKPPTPPTTQTPATQTQQTSTTQPAPTATPEQAQTPAPEAPAAAAPATLTAAGPITPITTANAVIIPVETNLYKAEISTDGGYLKAFLLKDYKETPVKNSPLMNLVSSNLGPDKAPLLLSINIGGSNIPPNSVYESSAGAVNLAGKPAGSTENLTLTLRTQQGFTIQRTYSFVEGDYRVGVAVKISEQPASTSETNIRAVSDVVAVNWFTNVDVKQSKLRFGTYAALTYDENGFEKQPPAKIAKKGPYTYPQVKWTGFADSYFLRALIPDTAAKATANAQGEGDNQIVTQIIEFPQGTLTPGQSVEYKLTAFLGPKEYNLLKAIGGNLQLDSAVEYGRLKPFVIALVWTLKMFNKLVHNWGLSIILLTVFIKLLFFPLTRSSFKQMKALQALQPRMKEIQAKYKDDRVKLNEEMMALYRSNKVNPLGGCLPMLLQLPVLYALYRALYVSIDLRYAPFVGWINDLSGPEHIFSLPVMGGMEIGVMPLLMGVSMFVQQKMTPTTMDPAQAKMFMAMPFVFTFISFGFPSGLVLYWSVSNLLTIAQQYVINRRGN